MTAATVSNFSSFLKTLYPNGFEDILYKNFPFFAMVKKDTGFEGNNRSIPVRYGSPKGGSVDFATAQANKAPSSVTNFLITRTKEYVLVSIDGETIRASGSNKGAVAQILKTEIDGGMNTFKRAVGRGVYGNGGGALGRASFSTVTATLATIQDVVNFEKGMVLQASSADGTSGSVRSGTVTVTSVDRNAGTLTAAANWSTGISGITNNDYLFRQGDFGGKLTGLSGWAPASAPGATAFFGVDRTGDVTRLGGVRITSSGTIEETLIDAAAVLIREGADPDYCFMNPTDWANLLKAVGSKVIIDVNTDNPRVGFKGIEVYGSGGPIKVMADPFCPKGTAYMSQLDTFTLYSLGDCPSIFMDDGNRLLREASADAYEVRIGAYLQLGCDAPGYTANITLP